MAKVSSSAMWSATGMANVQASAIPAYLKDKGLYDGSAFINDPDACSIYQEAPFQNTNLCSQGLLFLDFAKALCRAEMVSAGIAVGAYSVNKTGNCLAEWVYNDCFTLASARSAPTGNLFCLGYDNTTGYFSSSAGMGTVDVTRVGYAPFFFAMWGLFLQNIDGFENAFTRYCNTPEQNDKLRQKLACKMSGTIHDAMQKGDLNPASPSNTSVRRLTETQVRSAKFAPSTIYGTFKVMNLKATGQSKIPSFKSTRKFVGAFADKNRVLSEEEKGLVPQIGDEYILPKEVVAVCHLIAETRGSKRPMTNVMLRGDPSVGKTAGARAIAAGLGLPYTFITCNAGTEMYNFIGDMMPVDSSATSESINAELFKNLPSATDISIAPVNAYMAITGVSKPDATETECMTELFRKQLSLCADACKNGFKYVESPLVRAIRNGWVCELQEPSLITRPAVMPGLNGLLDETGCVVLPTGEMLHRHPDCIIISTLNIDLEGCRPLNQSFIDRHHIIMDMVTPSEAVIESRIRGMTGCDDTVPLKQMIAFVKEIAEICARFGATDGNVNSMRSLANWVQAGSITGNYATAATWTVISGATSDLATREELVRKLANYQF